MSGHLHHPNQPSNTSKHHPTSSSTYFPSRKTRSDQPLRNPNPIPHRHPPFLLLWRCWRLSSTSHNHPLPRSTSTSPMEPVQTPRPHKRNPTRLPLWRHHLFWRRQGLPPLLIEFPILLHPSLPDLPRYVPFSFSHSKCATSTPPPPALPHRPFVSGDIQILHHHLLHPLFSLLHCYQGSQARFADPNSPFPFIVHVRNAPSSPSSPPPPSVILLH